MLLLLSSEALPTRGSEPSWDAVDSSLLEPTGRQWVPWCWGGPGLGHEGCPLAQEGASAAGKEDLVVIQPLGVDKGLTGARPRNECLGWELG